MIPYVSLSSHATARTLPCLPSTQAPCALSGRVPGGARHRAGAAAAFPSHGAHAVRGAGLKGIQGGKVQRT